MTNDFISDPFAIYAQYQAVEPGAQRTPGETGATGATAATTVTIGSLITGATAKTTPVDADFVGLTDSAASNILTKTSWANIKATLKTYFDTLYQPVLPRMTTVQRDAISSPTVGMMIYNTTTNKLNVFTTVWETVTSA